MEIAQLIVLINLNGQSIVDCVYWTDISKEDELFGRCYTEEIEKKEMKYEFLMQCKESLSRDANSWETLKPLI